MRKTKESFERCLAAAQAGCPNALGETLRASQYYLMWIARRQIDPDLQAKAGASDLVQQTFLEARRDFATFSGSSEEALLAWLRRLLLNNMSNFYRHFRETAKRAVGEEVSLDSLRTAGHGEANVSAGGRSPCDEAIDHEERQMLQAAAAQLPGELRTIITMWHQEERSFEEIGRILGCAPNTVRNKWMKAIKIMQTNLKALV